MTAYWVLGTAQGVSTHLKYPRMGFTSHCCHQSCRPGWRIPLLVSIRYVFFFTWFDMEHQLFGGPCPPISRGNSWVNARTGYEPPWVTAAISQGFTPHWVLGNVRDQESSCWNLWRRLWTLRNLSLDYMFVFMRSTWVWFKLVQVGEILGWFHLQVISHSQSYRDCGTRYGGKSY